MRLQRGRCDWLGVVHGSAASAWWMTGRRAISLLTSSTSRRPSRQLIAQITTTQSGSSCQPTVRPSVCLSVHRRRRTSLRCLGLWLIDGEWRSTTARSKRHAWPARNAHCVTLRCGDVINNFVSGPRPRTWNQGQGSKTSRPKSKTTKKWLSQRQLY